MRARIGSRRGIVWPDLRPLPPPCGRRPEAAAYAVPAPLRADRSAFPRAQRRRQQRPAESRKLDGDARPRIFPMLPWRRGARIAPRAQSAHFFLLNMPATLHILTPLPPLGLFVSMTVAWPLPMPFRMEGASATSTGPRGCAGDAHRPSRRGTGDRVRSLPRVQRLRRVVHKIAFVHAGPSPAPSSPSQISSGTERSGAGREHPPPRDHFLASPCQAWKDASGADLDRLYP